MSGTSVHPIDISFREHKFPTMRFLKTLLPCLLGIAFACQSPKENKVDLFNGTDLTGWDTYIGPSFDTINGKRDSIPLGLNNDPLNVFSVVQEDGASAIRVSGQRFGGVSTQQAYENYHLTLEFKWGKQKWAPRLAGKRDSGLLYHAVGPHGADFGFWMRSQEFQIQEGDCADYWGVAGGVFDIPARKVDSANYVYDPSASLLTFSETSAQGRHCIKDPDAEKPTGEWNVLELYCHGDTAVHVVNGKVVMVLYHSRQADQGKESRLVKGKIQLQSEGAEVFFRNISIQPIERIPGGMLPAEKPIALN
jgi:hypothetical protein